MLPASIDVEAALHQRTELSMPMPKGGVPQAEREGGRFTGVLGGTAAQGRSLHDCTAFGDARDSPLRSLNA